MARARLLAVLDPKRRVVAFLVEGLGGGALVAAAEIAVAVAAAKRSRSLSAEPDLRQLRPRAAAGAACGGRLRTAGAGADVAAVSAAGALFGRGGIVAPAGCRRLTGWAADIGGSRRRHIGGLGDRDAGFDAGLFFGADRLAKGWAGQAESQRERRACQNAVVSVAAHRHFSSLPVRACHRGIGEFGHIRASRGKKRKFPRSNQPRR